MFGNTIAAFAVLAVGVSHARGQYTSVFLPDFDPQAVSMAQVGAADGTTTYNLVAGKPTGTLEAFPAGVTLTYLVGPSNVAWFGAMEGQSVRDSCDIGSDQMATCVLSADGAPPMTTLEPYGKEFAVAFAGAGATASDTASADASSSTTDSAAATGTASGSVTATGTGAAGTGTNTAAASASGTESTTGAAGTGTVSSAATGTGTADGTGAAGTGTNSGMITSMNSKASSTGTSSASGSAPSGTNGAAALVPAGLAIPAVLAVLASVF